MSIIITSTLRVKNRLGLHTRPATTIVAMLRNCKSHVHFTHKRETVNAKSILSLLMLAAQRNARITVTIEGEDAENTMEQLRDVFENSFGE